MERDDDLSGNDMAPALFLLSITARKGTHSGGRGGGQLEKVNGFQLYVEGFWVWEFRGQSTRLVPEF